MIACVLSLLSYDERYTLHVSPLLFFSPPVISSSSLHSDSIRNHVYIRYICSYSFFSLFMYGSVQTIKAGKRFIAVRQCDSDRLQMCLNLIEWDNILFCFFFFVLFATVRRLLTIAKNCLHLLSYLNLRIYFLLHFFIYKLGMTV